MSTANAVPVAAAPVDDITAANERIAKCTHNIAEMTASVERRRSKIDGIECSIQQLIKKRDKINYKCESICAKISEFRVAIVNARAVIDAAALQAAEIVKAESAAKIVAQDVAWLESVFSSPKSTTTPVEFGVNGHCMVTDKRRLALLVADSRRVDKRHWVTICKFNEKIDLTRFAGAGRVTLTRLPSVVDVSALASVERVSLFNLPNVSDISSLRGVHTLTLSNLPLIRDAGIVMLRGLYALWLSSLPLVTDTGIAALRGVHTLRLESMPSVSNAGIAALRGVEVFIMFEMPLVTDIVALECVPNLNVQVFCGRHIYRGNPVHPFQF